MTIKPFLKWVGGKTQHIDEILGLFPKKINNYYEFFLGGGSVLFSLLNNDSIKINKYYVFDINECLINTYINIRDSPDLLINSLETLTKSFNDSKDKEKFFYDTREQYNNTTDKKTIIASTYFIFLNKVCFRGVYREGPNGFNVPYGNYKNPTIFEKDTLLEISNKIKNVQFITGSFKQTMNINFSSNDFVYIDPPYYPEKPTSFVKYSNNGFNDKDHEELFSIIKKISCKFIMSNSNTKTVIDEFKDHDIQEISTRRRINSKNPESMSTEILIKKK